MPRGHQANASADFLDVHLGFALAFFENKFSDAARGSLSPTSLGHGV
jgi:hypothetical protein